MFLSNTETKVYWPVWKTNIDLHLNKIAVKGRTQKSLPVIFLNMFKINLMTERIIAVTQVLEK
jgi:hypothetical protein